MTWELFQGKRSKLAGNPTVTLTKNGIIYLSITTMRTIVKDDKFALLMFDAERATIGIKILKEANADAYPIRRFVASGQISAWAFMKHFRIIPENSQRFPASFDKETSIIEVDVSKLGKEKMFALQIR